MGFQEVCEEGWLRGIWTTFCVFSPRHRHRRRPSRVVDILLLDVVSPFRASLSVSWYPELPNNTKKLRMYAYIHTLPSHFSSSPTLPTTTISLCSFFRPVVIIIYIYTSLSTIIPAIPLPRLFRRSSHEHEYRRIRNIVHPAHQSYHDQWPSSYSKVSIDLCLFPFFLSLSDLCVRFLRMGLLGLCFVVYSSCLYTFLIVFLFLFSPHALFISFSKAIFNLAVAYLLHLPIVFFYLPPKPCTFIYLFSCFFIESVLLFIGIFNLHIHSLLGYCIVCQWYPGYPTSRTLSFPFFPFLLFRMRCGCVQVILRDLSQWCWPHAPYHPTRLIRSDGCRRLTLRSQRSQPRS